MEKGWAWEIAVPFVGGEGCGRPTRGAHTLGDWPVVPTGEGEGTPRGAGPLPFRGWILCLRRNDGENGRGRGWKVPDGCAVRRRRLHRCMWSATADVPHRRRLCDSPELLRGCGGDARKSRCGAVSTTRSARPYGDMGAWTLCRRCVAWPLRGLRRWSPVRGNCARPLGGVVGAVTDCRRRVKGVLREGRRCSPARA